MTGVQTCALPICFLPSKNILVGGYTNGVISYLPTAEEYKYGGYECDYAHHSWGLIEQVAPETEGLLLDASSVMLEEVWNQDSV